MTTITEDETSISSGAYVGFGFRTSSTATQIFIIDVFESGPAWAAGVRRGMELVAVDTGSGFETLDELSAREATSEEIFGPGEVGAVRNFRFVQNDAEVEISIAKDELAPPALAGEPLLIERAGLTPVGYLHLRQFINAALTPEDGFSSLADATTLFKEANVTDLIIDLRYNGGGLLSVADTMMDLLAGLTATGEPSFKIQVNDQHPDFNDDTDNWGLFDERPETFSPVRVAFITSGSTASASELVINGLDPHLEVVMVGENSFGKQVGQGRWDMHDGVEGLERADCDVALRLTAFEIVNGENQGGYHQVGLEGTGRFTLCAAEDDIFNPFGDPQETLVATALDWLGTGACPTSASAGTPSAMANQRSALPPWLAAEYIPERVDGNLR
jgi:C-terminal processing protease CtpA/Prc